MGSGPPWPVMAATPRGTVGEQTSGDDRPPSGYGKCRYLASDLAKRYGRAPPGTSSAALQRTHNPPVLGSSPSRPTPQNRSLESLTCGNP